MIMYELGDMSGAPALIERLRELIERLGARAWEPGIGLHVAQLHETEGRHLQAIDEVERCIPMARARSVGFYAPRMLGYFAMLTGDPVARTDALSEGEAMLREGSLSHNFLGFYRYAMDACLRSGDWDEAERYATAVEIYTESEPLPLYNFYVARGRALSAHGRGQRHAATMQELKRLRGEAERIGLGPAVLALETALVTL